MTRSILKSFVTPAISLGSGAATLFLFRRGIGFAPVSLGIAVLAWMSAVLFARFYTGVDNETGGDGAERSQRRRLFRFASKTVVMGLYQNVLFFLLPVWFGSAEPSSVNIVFPVLLSGLALFACFDDHFTAWVIAHPVRRTLASGVLIFSVSIPAISLFGLLPLRVGVGICAAASAFAAMLLGLAGRRVPERIAAGIIAALLFGGVFYLLSPLLPPVPVQCVSVVAATGLDGRVPVGVADTFPTGTKSVFVHFSVAAPDRFEQQIRFQWYVNGEKRGNPLPSSIVGGRKRGFRTWTFRSRPPPGRYRVDLETIDGQLIGRGRFRVR